MVVVAHCGRGMTRHVSERRCATEAIEIRLIRVQALPQEEAALAAAASEQTGRVSYV